MAKRTIKHVSFSYKVELPDGRISEVHAAHGETVDIPRQEDLDLGEKFGAFYTDEELKVVSAPTAQAAGAESPDDAGQSEELDLALDPAEDVALWIQEDSPSINDVLEAVGESSDPIAAATNTLEAENLARSGDPRKGLVAGLHAIIERNNE